MSKYVKSLMADQLRQRFDGVTDLVLVDVIGIDANQNVDLRRRLREKEIHIMVVKNSLARRATEGTALAPAFEGRTGSNAAVWGAEDIITLAKEVVQLAESKEFEKLAATGGVMDGKRLSAEQVKEVSKWPSRPELLSLVAGQLVAPGAELASQLTAPAAEIASQIEKLIEMKEESPQPAGS